MDEIFRLIKEYSEYNIDNYQYLSYEEIINLPEFIMVIGLVILSKDFKINFNNKDLDLALYENRNNLVHHNDINKDGNEKTIVYRLYKSLTDIIKIIIKNY